MKMIQVSTLRRMGVLGMTAAAALSLDACVTTPAPVAVVPGPPIVATAPVVVQTAPVPLQTAQVPPAQMQVAPRGLSDGRIVALVTDVNNIEIHQAQLALRRSRNPRVRAYSQRIIRADIAQNNTLLRVASAQGIQPMEARMAMRVRMQNAEQRQMRQLAALSGPAFDRAYLDAQIDGHRRIINAMDQRLLPNTSNPQLRVALQRERPRQVAQLQQAQQIRTTL